MQTLFLFLGSLGAPEILMILFIVLLLFGARKIPELAKGLGRGIREFKDASKEIKKNIDEEMDNVKEPK